MRQRARLKQPGPAQRRRAHQDARPEADAARELVGLMGQTRVDAIASLADRKAIADGEAEPRQKGRIDRDAIGAALLGQRIGERLRRIENRPRRRADKARRQP